MYCIVPYKVYPRGFFFQFRVPLVHCLGLRAATSAPRPRLTPHRDRIRLNSPPQAHRPRSTAFGFASPYYPPRLSGASIQGRRRRTHRAARHGPPLRTLPSLLYLGRPPVHSPSCSRLDAFVPRLIPFIVRVPVSRAVYHF
jgi:hypothetical protein